jgi:hypothetical protein
MFAMRANWEAGCSVPRGQARYGNAGTERQPLPRPPNGRSHLPRLVCPSTRSSAARRDSGGTVGQGAEPRLPGLSRPLATEPSWRTRNSRNDIKISWTSYLIYTRL